jgi:hypothetical protein
LVGAPGANEETLLILLSFSRFPLRDILLNKLSRSTRSRRVEPGLKFNHTDDNRYLIFFVLFSVFSFAAVDFIRTTIYFIRRVVYE